MCGRNDDNPKKRCELHHTQFIDKPCGIRRKPAITAAHLPVFRFGGEAIPGGRAQVFSLPGDVSAQFQ